MKYFSIKVQKYNQSVLKLFNSKHKSDQLVIEIVRPACIVGYSMPTHTQTGLSFCTEQQYAAAG